MALDVGLMSRVRSSGESVFRVYSWRSPTLSVGRNQPTKGCYDPHRLAAEGIEIVRRPTGGRAVLHWRELTYSVTAPVRAEASTHETCAEINSLLLAGLRRLGAVATTLRSAAARVPSSHPCFAEPSAGEIVAENGAGAAKLVASAQVRENGVLLQHGSILIQDDQSRVADLSLRPVAPPRGTTLQRMLGRAPSFSEIADALFAAVQRSTDPAATEVSAAEALPLAAPHVARFRDPLWTWRR
jgi:lipoyl(octanoyl) transferase